MFDSSCSIFSDGSSQSQPKERIKTFKDFVLKHANNLRQRLEGTNEESYTHELCPLELKPILKDSGDSFESIFRFKEDYKKKSKKRYKNRHRNDRPINFCNYVKNSTTSSDPSLNQDSINFCGLLCRSKDKVDSTELFNEYSTTDTNNVRKLVRTTTSQSALSLPQYEPKYQIMVVKTKSQSETSAADQNKVKVELKSSVTSEVEVKTEDIKTEDVSKAGETPSAQDISENDTKTHKYTEDMKSEYKSKAGETPRAQDISENDTKPHKYTEDMKSEYKSEAGETPKAQDSKNATKTHKYIYCKENPCLDDKCCGQSHTTMPCVRFENFDGPNKCYRYKCNSLLSSKCFPPVEIAPCNVSCKDCSREGAANTKECPCFSGDDGPKSVRSKRSSTLGPGHVCNPDYVFPDGRKRIKINRTAKVPMVQPVVGICTEGHCGSVTNKGMEKYAVVKITEFEQYSIYEIMKPSSVKPKRIPNCIEEIFVKKRDVS